MNWRVLGALLLLAPGLGARQVIVETRDGQTFEGQVRLASNLLIVANAPRGVLAEIPATNVLLATFRADPLEFTVPAVSPPEPAGALPASWKSEDIGATNIAGNATFSSGLFRVASAGPGVMSSRDGFRFVYRPVKGDSEIMARIIYVQRTAPWTMAGLMIRENLSADSPNVLLGVTGARGGMFQWRENAGGNTVGVHRRDLFVPHWLKLKRQGELITAYHSRNGQRWWPVGQINLPMADNIYVGLAVAGGTNLNQAVPGAGPYRATLDFVREAPWLPGAFVPRAQLQSGSVVVGRIESADAAELRYEGPWPRPPVSTRHLSALFFQWLPYRFNPVIRAGQPGALLANGDFLEGEFRGIARGRVYVSSVLFGMQSFDMSDEIMAFVFRKPATERAWCTVKTTDGTVWCGSELAIAPDEVVLREASVGSCRIPIYEIAEIWGGF